MKLIIDIPEVDYNYAKQQVADGITNPLKIFIANGTPIPDNATNGEVMKIMFMPNQITRTDDIVHIDYDFTPEWWNSPYQKGGKERDYDVECRNHSEMIFNAQKGGKG